MKKDVHHQKRMRTLRVHYGTVYLLLILFITCSKDTRMDEADALIEILATSTDPPDGSPSLLDLSNLGLQNLKRPQEEYERAFANIEPWPNSLSEAQHVIDLVNDRATKEAQLAYGVTLAGGEFGTAYPGVYNTDYVYPAASHLDYYHGKGLKLIRLAFSWERIQPILNGQLDLAELKRIRDFVKMAADRKMYVILNMHNFGRYNLNGLEEIIGSHNVTMAHCKDVWTKLAAVFKGNLGIWGYGLMNEPHDMLPEAPWVNIAQEIINGIRTVDGHTQIVVGGDSYSSAAFWPEYSDNLKTLIDPSNKLVFEAHVYFDTDYSGRYKGTYEDEGGYPNIGVDRVQPFLNWLQTNELKGFVGEYGVPNNDERWLTVLDNLLTHLNTNGINGAYWAGGPWWADYPLSIEPHEGIEKAQMAIVQKYLAANLACNSDFDANHISQ